MLRAGIERHTLRFKVPARTSRGELADKQVYLLKIYDESNPSVTGIGECSTLSGLSYDDKEEYESTLECLCRDINLPVPQLKQFLSEWPSIRFGMECALIDLSKGGRGLLFETPFTKGEKPIPINGLVWMGDIDHMRKQVQDKIAAGFKVIKLKVGALDFDSELSLLHDIRKAYSAKDITLRLDANGAFACTEALDKLNALAPYDIHSIEQPVKAGNPALLRMLCEQSPVPIALDEELIGHHDTEERFSLLTMVQPAYVILKPSLLGGFSTCNDWIRLCRTFGIGFWITSALESNIGLSAIAQYTSTLGLDDFAQGLGTGTLYENNFPSDVEIRDAQLWYKH